MVQWAREQDLEFLVVWPSEESVRAGFSGGKYERLAALKEQWDPENLFSGNHNIAPR